MLCFLNASPYQKLFRERASSRPEARRYQASLEHFAVPETKKCPTNWDVAKVHRSQLAGAPTDQMWDEKATKTTVMVMDCNTLNENICTSIVIPKTKGRG